MMKQMGGGAMKRVKKKTKKGQKKAQRRWPDQRRRAPCPCPKKEFRLPGLDPLADQLEKAGHRHPRARVRPPGRSRRVSHDRSPLSTWLALGRPYLPNERRFHCGRQTPPDAYGQEEAAHLPNRRRRRPFAPRRPVHRDRRYLRPRREPSAIQVDNEKAVAWLQNGAQPTERVDKLLKISGAMGRVRGRQVPRSPPRPPSERGTARAEAVLTHVVTAIVDHPDDVKVSTDQGRDPVRINIEVGDGDMGRVIGRRGRVANAIRAVGRAAAAADDVDVDVEFVD